MENQLRDLLLGLVKERADNGRAVEEIIGWRNPEDITYWLREHRPPRSTEAEVIEKAGRFQLSVDVANRIVFIALDESKWTRQPLIDFNCDGDRG